MRTEQKEIVLEKWDELITELDIFLTIGKKGGGTMGHKIGSMRDQQKRLKKSFTSYT